MLCNRCRSIDFQGATEVSRTHYVLHRARNSFSKSIDEQCSFCILIRAQLGDTEVENDLLDQLGAYVALRLRVIDDDDDDEDREQSWTITVISSLGNAVLDEISEIPDPYRQALNNHLKRCTKDRLDRSRHHAVPPLNTELINLWNRECINNHSQCRIGSPGTGTTELPCRLINVTDPHKPFLVETSGRMKAVYVALSYCWGSRLQTRTLKDTLRLHRTRIPVETLSKTCRDAILAAHLLGHDYLWIDALCIVQDDDEDKGSEIARMGNIYRFAVLTICVEGSPDAHTGVFSEIPTDPREVYPCQVTISAVIGDRVTTRRLTLAGSRTGDNFLGKRGWTLQEEALTSRALVIGRGVTSWRCAAATACDTNPVPRPLPFDPYPIPFDCLDDEQPMVWSSSLDIARMRLWLYGPSGPRRLTRQEIDAEHPAFTAWYALIEGYSDRDLTHVTDTLPAVLGIATVLSESLKTQYAQGLWTADLPRGLLWYVAVNDERHTMGPSATLEHGITSPPGPEIPSWSWAAVGKVRIRFCALRYVGEWSAKSFAQILMSRKGGKESQLLARGRVVRMDLAVSQEFTTWRTDRIYGSRRVYSHESVIESVATAGVHPRFPALLVDPSGEENIVGEAALDHPFENSQQHMLDCHSGKIEIHCLILQEWQADDKECRACLILASVDGDTGSYRRLGIGFLSAVRRPWGREEVQEATTLQII